jgi:hypothetical protein
MIFVEQLAPPESLEETASDERIAPSLSPSPPPIIDEASPTTTDLNNKAVKGGKKRPLLRKEIQRRYRERMKLRQQVESATQLESDEEVALLVAENKKMEDERQALLAALHQAHLMTELLESSRLSTAAATASASEKIPFNPHNTNEVADALFSNSLHGYEPSEYLVHKYAQLPFGLLIDRDKHHFNHLLDTLLAEWYSSWTCRDGITMKLHKLFNTRRRIATIIAEESPGMHKSIMQSALQPAPGSALGDLAAQALKRAARDIKSSDQQIDAIQNAWLEYTYAIETLNFDVELAKLSVSNVLQAEQRTSPSIIGATKSTAEAANQHQKAQDFLNLSTSVSTLSQSSSRMSVAYTRLAGVVLSSLDVIQIAKLFRGCRPYFPNHVQLCKLIIEGDSV